MGVVHLKIVREELEGLPMNTIDELSKTLGTMQSDIAHIRNQTSSIDGKVSKTNEKMIIAETAIKSAHRRLDDLQEKVDNHEDIKNKGVGALTILATVIGIIGAIVAKVFDHILRALT